MSDLKILLFSDFDGTITGRAGSKVVFGPFYQGLLQGYTPDQEKVLNYKNTPFKEKSGSHIEAICDAFINKFGKYDEKSVFSSEDADLLMSRDAVHFYKMMLKNDKVQVNIVTKNRSDYIKAMFSYQGFSPEEIKKLTIRDEARSKYDIVSSALKKEKKLDSCILYIFDDSQSDYEDMTKAVKVCVGDDWEKITIADNKNPGKFEWSVYLKQIGEITGNNVLSENMKKSIKNTSFLFNESSTYALLGILKDKTAGHWAVRASRTPGFITLCWKNDEGDVVHIRLGYQKGQWVKCTLDDQGKNNLPDKNFLPVNSENLGSTGEELIDFLQREFDLDPEKMFRPQEKEISIVSKPIFFKQKDNQRQLVDLLEQNTSNYHKH